MWRIFFILMALVSCQNEATLPDAELNTRTDSVSYSLGVNMANNLKERGFEQVDPLLMAQAMDDVLNQQGARISNEQSILILQHYVQKIEKKQSERNLDLEKEFLLINRKKTGVEELPSGLQYKVLEAGNGEQPSLESSVSVHYRAMFINGKVYRSSLERGMLYHFAIADEIAAWQEALPMMHEGAKWRLFVPAHLAYGANPPRSEAIAPNQTLIMDIELIEIEDL